MQFPKLNFPNAEFRFQKKSDRNVFVFDIVRKKFIKLNPEEWVRQHIIHFLVSYKSVPISKLSIEKQLVLNNTKRRTDIVIYDKGIAPLVLIECKAYDVELNQNVIDQALRYNLELKVPFVFLSNGLQHFFIKTVSNNFEQLNDFPEYEMLNL
jgi:type I site-specific restriction endonuclease